MCSQMHIKLNVCAYLCFRNSAAVKSALCLLITCYDFQLGSIVGIANGCYVRHAGVQLIDLSKPSYFPYKVIFLNQ